MAESWLRFWDRPHSIYVNDRHLRVHYAHIADEILSALPRRPNLTVLDFACGEALEAARIAAQVDRLYLYDGAPSVRAHLSERFRGVANIVVLDDAGLAGLAEGGLDAIFVVSVVQYIAPAELPALLQRWQRLLKPDGQLIVSDVIPPDAGMIADITSLLTTAGRHGFLMAALGGMAATLFSDYRRLRRQLGFSVYSDAEMQELLRAAGFATERLPRNLGFHPGRHSYIARLK
jgi:ubiquinone/menaquinone biosynthesis C-methylase UbiE